MDARKLIDRQLCKIKAEVLPTLTCAAYHMRRSPNGFWRRHCTILCARFPVTIRPTNLSAAPRRGWACRPIGT